MKHSWIALPIALLVSSEAFAFEASEFLGLSSLTSSSTLENQVGSTMTNTVDSAGNVTGRCINCTIGTGCQNTPHPNTGRVTGNFSAFSVGWENSTENCNSATNWAVYAQATNSSFEIVTNWNLAYLSPFSPIIEQGSGTFIYEP
ncbi:MAG: hypothetical protein ABJP66_05695 [Hyphomicrobiales bacterium]